MTDHPSDVLIAPSAASAAVAVELIDPDTFARALDGAGPLAAGLAEGARFTGKSGQVLVVPGADGRPLKVLYGAPASDRLTALRSLQAKLPAGDFVIAGDATSGAPPLGVDGAVAFALGAYRFDRYKKDPAKPRARLVVMDADVLSEARRIAAACALARDMINTPASHMGPVEIETIAREMAADHGAQISVIVGDDLLEKGYPAVHAVGRAAAADRAPRLIELTWTGPSAPADAPVIALVGKGVTFDTGGLDLKPSSGMRWMKKDMGGAAHVLALTRLVMAAGLPVRLVTLIPAVENAVSGNAMRPGDVLGSRAGLTIEVGNTDAEGRLILADALTRAGEHEPALTIDLATLTGAARVALGPEVVPFYTADDGFAAHLLEASAAHGDPLWRMPLWAGYEASLDSDVADLKNDPDGWAQAGSVTAALFLQRFAPKTGVWAHLDIFAWNGRSRAGWPAGAEAQGVRAIYALLQTWPK